MKKVLAILCSIVLVMGMAVPFVGAVFMNSPSTQPAPELVRFESSNKDYNGQLEVVSYADRENLTEEQKKAFEDSYESIKNATSVEDLNADLKATAEKYNIDLDDLAVSDLFYLDENNATAGTDGTYTVTLKSENFDKAVSVAAFKDGKWIVADDIKLDKDGNLVFSTEDLGAIAVVARTDGGESPIADTGIGTAGIVAIVIGAIVVAGAVVACLYFFVFKKKPAAV